jgi:TOTE conflict system primase-like protein
MSMNRTGPGPDKIDTYLSLFHGRQDVFAHRWTSRRTGRSGYAPVLRSSGFMAGRPKPDPAPEDYEPLTKQALIDRHLHGDETLGIYPLLPDGTAWFLAFDFDGETALTEAKRLLAVCEVQELPAYLEISRSGNYHLWMFFSTPIVAWKARRVGIELLKEAGLGAYGTNGKTDAYDRMFPSQDYLTGRGLGNLIALPLQGNAVLAGRTEFLNPENGFEPFPNQWMFLSGLRRVSEPMLLGIDLMRGVPMDAAPSPVTPRQTPQSALGRSIEAILNTSTNGHDRAALARLRHDCAFVQHCADDARTLPETHWWALASNLAPFGELGREKFHDFSRAYPNYHPQETDAKFDQARTADMPHTCQYIRTRVWDCGRDCGVKAPCSLRKNISILFVPDPGTRSPF